MPGMPGLSEANGPRKRSRGQNPASEQNENGKVESNVNIPLTKFPLLRPDSRADGNRLTK